MAIKYLSGTAPDVGARIGDDMQTQYSGSCLCGAVHFKIEGAFERFYLCHCSHCRKDTGSAHAANLFSSTAKLEWLSGQDKVRTFNLQQTRHTRSFCSVCGSAIPHASEKMLVVPAGCLDTELVIEADAHIFVASRAAWDHDLASAPSFDAFPS
jgi:hypothetical protein